MLQRKSLPLGNVFKMLKHGFVTVEFGMAPSVSVNLVSLITSCVGLREEEPQTAHPMSFTWAVSMLTGC